MADDVVVMYAARAVEKAPAGELFARPQHPYTRGLLNSVPSIYERKERLETIAGQPPELTQAFVGCPFAPRCPQALEECRRTDPPEYRPGDDSMAKCLLYGENGGLQPHQGKWRPSAL